MRFISYLLLTTSALLAPSPVFAHAFGQLYTLPIPLWLYLFGAGAALIVSFLLIAFFAKESTHFSFPQTKFKLPNSLTFLFQVLSVGLLFLTILAGFFGSSSPSLNFAPNFFWIIFLLGFTYLTAILGNMWEVINPFKILASPLSSKPLIKYPKYLGYFPAFIFYFGLIYLELLGGGLASKPFFLSQLLIFYTLFNILGASLFGKDIWFEIGDFFSVFFRLLGKRDFKNLPKHFSLLIFIIFMLSSTAFDGFRSTIVYFRYFYTIEPVILLILSLGLFLSLYLLAIFLMRLITKTSISLKDLSLHFAYSLIPIALAYNIAHYFTLLLTQGQQIIPLLSDPLNQGLNLFGTSDYQINISIINAGLVWNIEVLVIILGHILAVVVAHLLALRVFKKKDAFLSQLPMLILMVLYTITGLWILSQPLTIG